MSSNKPRVSIGMPVYNGEKFVRETLESILAQTFADFELIISDNASTDKTEKICREYAAGDRRIRYYRNAQNRGAAWNYNRVFELSSGEYFKWIAHDDLNAPDFIAKCVEVLDRDNSVVLCHSKVKIIDEQGNFLQTYNVNLNTDSPKPQERFHELLSKHLCYQIFGVIRSCALKLTPLLGTYGHADGVLLVRLALLGRFHEIPEYLFFIRNHPQQASAQFMTNYQVFTSHHPQPSSSMLPDYHSYSVWWDSAKAGKILFPHWRIAREYWLSIWQAPISWYERICCCRSMSKQLRGTEHLLIEDLLIAAKQKLKHFQQLSPSQNQIPRS